MAPKTLLILAAGPLQLPALFAAKRLGLQVVAADGNPQAVGLPLADRSLVVDIRDPQAVLEAIRDLDVHGAIAICTEIPLASLAAVNEARDLAGPRPEVINGIVDKSQMRALYEQSGVPSPASIPCTTLEEAQVAFHRISGRVIVKPAVGMGSRGIFDLEDTELLPEAFARSMACSRIGKVLVEEFVEGPEFSVEALTWHGRTEVVTITEKCTSGSPYWVEMGHTQPPSLSAEARAALVEATRNGIAALGLDWSASHTEVKLTPKGPRLIETGGRLGGDFITTHLTPLSTGIDMVEAAICLAMGEVPRLARLPRERGSAIRYFAAPPGILGQDLDLSAVRTLPGVVEVGSTFHAGDEIPPVRSSGDRTAWVIASGETSEAAASSAEAGVAALRAMIHTASR